MDKLHKVQLQALVESYRATMNDIETWDWCSSDYKRCARLECLQNHMEQLLVLLADQEKLLD